MYDMCEAVNMEPNDTINAVATDNNGVRRARELHRKTGHSGMKRLREYARHHGIDLTTKEVAAACSGCHGCLLTKQRPRRRAQQ